MSRWTIHLRPLPSDVPDAVRIRGLLKVALRRFKLRALEVQQQAQDTPGNAQNRRQGAGSTRNTSEPTERTEDAGGAPGVEVTPQQPAEPARSLP